MRFANIPLHPGAAQGRPGQTDVDRVFRGDDADPYRAAQPYAIFIEHRLVLVYVPRKSVAEGLHLLLESIVGVVCHAADAKGVASQTRSEEVLEDLQYL